MSIFKSRQLQSAETAAASTKEERKNSEYWINIGYSVETTDDAGNKVKVFIALNRGIPMDDIEMLEDLITAAFNGATQRVAEKAKESMAELTAGMPLPPGMKMPF